jgi:hypothetical protein
MLAKSAAGCREGVLDEQDSGFFLLEVLSVRQNLSPIAGKSAEK